VTRHTVPIPVPLAKVTPHDLPCRAVERAANEQVVPADTTGIWYEAKKGHRHDEISRSDNRANTEVEGRARLMTMREEAPMPQTVASVLVGVLEQIGVKHIFGLIGDSLNPLADAVRRSDIEWIGVRHEEGAALAAAGQAKLKLNGPAVVDCVVAADEMPNLPHIDLETVGNFAMAKIREALLAVTGP